MSVELLYTSAPQGLKQGSRGFSTVLCTVGLPANLASRLESLSGYRHVFPPNHPQAASNPVCYSHLRFTVGGKQISILSRISDFGIDYSQRTNKLAHHVVLDASEQPLAGPAWLLSQSQLMRSNWDGACKTLPSGPAIPQADQPTRICENWQRVTGDAGWGGVVAEAFASTSNKPLWIVYKLEQSSQLLTLLNEAVALLPSQERWRATFSTYATNLPPEADCRVRCVLEGTEEARVVVTKGSVVSLIAVPNQPPVGIFVRRAQTGLLPTETPIVALDAPLPENAQYQHSDKQSLNAAELQVDNKPPAIRRPSHVVKQAPVVRHPDNVVDFDKNEPRAKWAPAVHVAIACAALSVLAALIAIVYTATFRNLTVAIFNEDSDTSTRSGTPDQPPAKPIIIDRTSSGQGVQADEPQATVSVNSSTSSEPGNAITSPKNVEDGNKAPEASGTASSSTRIESNGSSDTAVNQEEGKLTESAAPKPTATTNAPKASDEPVPKADERKAYVDAREEHLLRGRIEGVCQLYLAKSVLGITVSAAGADEKGVSSKNGGRVSLIKKWSIDNTNALEINISFPGDGKEDNADVNEALKPVSDYVAKLRAAKQEFHEAFDALKKLSFKSLRGKLPASTDITLEWLTSFSEEPYFVEYNKALNTASAEADRQRAELPPQFVEASRIMNNFEKQAKELSDAVFELEELRLDNVIKIRTFVAANPPKSGSVQDGALNLTLKFKIKRK